MIPLASKRTGEACHNFPPRHAVPSLKYGPSIACSLQSLDRIDVGL